MKEDFTHEKFLKFCDLVESAFKDNREREREFLERVAQGYREYLEGEQENDGREYREKNKD